MFELKILICCDQATSGLFTLCYVLAQFCYDVLNEGKFNFGKFCDEFVLPVLGRFDADILKSLKS